MEEKFKASVERQVENPDWDKINALADEKLIQLNNLISKEGALHIAVKELHSDYQMERPGGSGSEIKGRLINKTKPRFVETNKSGKTAIRDVFIATEETGVLQATLWGKARVELFKEIDHGDAINMKGVKINSKDGETVLSFFDNSTVEKLADGDVKALSEMLKPVDISAVKKSSIGTVSGLIIEAKDIEYKVCPVCNRRLSEVEDTYICDVHNEVQPESKTAKDITMDTGNGIIQTVLWPETLEEGKEPHDLEKIEAVCRVYDKNFYAREKAGKESEVTAEVLAKQFPVVLNMTVYSYHLEQVVGIGVSADDSAKKLQTQSSTQSKR